MKNNRYTFWKLISEKKIVIPIIQRDYAQGREGKEYVRKNFLEQLGKALGLTKCDKAEEQVAELDFVYGTETKDYTKSKMEMLPLDGQQRLTTLWLLHWYVAYKAKELPKAKEVLKRFSYETRTSSREFCEKLCELECQEEGRKIVEHIKQQTWFFSAWNQNPTIKSMLRMLSGTDNSETNNGEDFVDGIEELFKGHQNFNEYWAILTKDDCPIHFNFLPLQSYELPVSDDLYIKMNARGKALTSFENFKAELVDWIYKDKNKSLWGENDSEQNKNRATLASAIDNQWTDVFWKNKTDDGRIDEIYFAFLNRFFLNELITLRDGGNKYLYTAEFLQDGDKEKSIAPKEFDYLYGTYYVDSAKKSDDTRISYNSFEIYKIILERKPAILPNLQKLFDNIIYSGKESINDIIRQCTSREGNTINFIPVYQEDSIETFSKESIKKISEISQAQRVVFYSVCRYLIQCGDNFNESKFKNWLRVVWNIVENSNESSNISGFVGTIRMIDTIAEGCGDIYEFLSKCPTNEKTDKQLKEEIEKAKQILLPQDSSTLPQKPDNWAEDAEWDWEAAIIEAENHAFFRGAIRFLFYNEKGEVDWTNYHVKWEKAQEFFDAKGIKPHLKEKKILLRTLVMMFNDWGQFWRLKYDNRTKNWKQILTDANLIGPVSRLMMTYVSEKELTDFKSELDNNDYQKSVHNEMVNTLLLSRICDECILKWRPDWSESYALYPYNCKNAEHFYIFNKRNSLLNGFKSTQRLDGLDFFWGKEVHFEYKSHSFCWQTSNWIDMYKGDEKLYDRGGEYEQLHTHFLGTSEHSFTDADQLVQELERCIKKEKELSELKKES